MSSRSDYLTDLLNDGLVALTKAGVPQQNQGPVLAAVVIADALNGLRKAIVESQRRPSN